MREPGPATKRWVAILAICTMAWSIAACGDSDGDDTTNAADSSAASAGRTTPADTSATTTEGRGDAGQGSAQDDTGEGQGNDRGGSDQQGSGRQEPQSKGSEQGQIAATVEGLYGDIVAGDARGVCSAMSAAAQRQIAQQVPGGSGTPPAKRTCVASMEKFVAAAGRSGVLEQTFQAKVTDVSIEGNVATVTVAFGGRSGDRATSGTIRLQKENGRWVFGASAVSPRS